MKKREYSKVENKSKNDKGGEIKKSKTNQNVSPTSTTKKVDYKNIHKTSASSHRDRDKNIATKNKVNHQTKDYKASKPNFKLVENLKTDWNKVRVKALSTDDRNKLMQKMADKVKGKILQITLRHDVSRIVQSILQFGSNTLRSGILKEISSKVLDISKTPYGHFTILKIIAYCNSMDDQTMIANALNGHFVSIGTNVIGARIVESILQLYPAKLTKSLKAEFYGKNFKILMGEAPKNLKSIIETLPNKVSNVLDHMRDLIQKLIEKGLLDFSYVHNLLYEYVVELHNYEKYSKIEELSLLLSDSLPKLITTKAGSKAVVYLITHANAKSRKNMMKSLKSKVLESLLHPSGHLAVIRLIQCTDDVVNIQKMILNEIKSTQVNDKYSASGDLLTNLSSLPSLLQLSLSPYGSKFLLFLLSNNSNFKYLEPDEKPLFVMESTTSKKTDSARKKDHLLYMKSSVITVCNQYLPTLVRNRYGSKVVQEIIKIFYPSHIITNLARICVNLEPITSVTDNNTHDACNEFDNEDENDEDDNEEEEERQDIDEDGEGGEIVNDDNINENEDDIEDFKEYEDLADEFLEGIDVDDEKQGGVGDNAEDVDTKKNKNSNKKQKKGNVEDQIVVELTAINEDPIVHSMLKNITFFEKLCEKDISATDKVVGTQGEEVKDVDVTTIDKTFWDDSESIGTSFSSQLLFYINSENKWSEWLTHNRPSLVIAWCIQVPSSQEFLKILKNKDNQKLLKAQIHQGGKVIVEELSKL